MKKYWEKILRKNLKQIPGNDQLHKKEHRNDFYTPENLGVTIHVKKKIYTKPYFFGGPIYHAIVNLNEKTIKVTFIPPKYRGKDFEIQWDIITRLTLHFLTKT